MITEHRVRNWECGTVWHFQRYMSLGELECRPGILARSCADWRPEALQAEAHQRANMHGQCPKCATVAPAVQIAAARPQAVVMLTGEAEPQALRAEGLSCGLAAGLWPGCWSGSWEEREGAWAPGRAGERASVPQYGEILQHRNRTKVGRTSLFRYQR